MAPKWRLSRRLILGHGTVLALSLLTGCTDQGVSDGDDGRDSTDVDDGASTDVDDGTSTDTDDENTIDTGDGDSTDTEGGDSAGADGGDLDLREANVVGVSFERQDGSYTFDVTLHHDDDGEDGYANWWQVERLDGTRLGRRELLHAHSQQPFTRSETIDVPEDVQCIVVRGHDETHGYGGLASVIRLDSGETRSIDQGPDRQTFDAGDCPP